MKNKLKLSLLLLGIVIGLCSCQEEKIEHVNVQAPPAPAYKMTKVSKSFFKENELLSKSILELKEAIGKNKTNSLNKTVYSSEFDFTINTDYASYVENDDATYHSFTFPIERTIDNGLLENLLFSLQLDGSYKTFIVEYNITLQEQDDIENDIEVDLENKIIFTEIDGTGLGVEIFSKTTVCGPSSLFVCWDTACEIDGCWDSQYTGVSCGSIIIHNMCGGGSSGDSGGPGGDTGSGSTGSGAGGSNDDSSDVTTPVVPCRENCPEELCTANGTVATLGANLGLNADQVACLEDEDNCEKTNALDNFVYHNPNETAFAQLAVQAICDGADVDYVNKIMYYINKPCQKQIVKDVIAVSSDLTNLINNTFGVSEKANLKFWNGTLSNPNSNANTSPFFEGNSSDYIIKIGYADTFLDVGTDLSIAAVTLHEVIHAYFISLYLEGNLVSDDNNYDNLLKAFVAFYADPSSPTYESANAEIHNAMNTFIDQIAASILAYAQSKNISGVDLAYCKKLAWATMLNTTLINEMLTPAEIAAANNIMLTEQNNNEYDPSVPVKGNACE